MGNSREVDGGLPPFFSIFLKGRFIGQVKVYTCELKEKLILVHTLDKNIDI